jgi:glycosyltransferase involved in cell wall biosynthesis
MKVALIGPGIMPIPPTGWGAVEVLIWDYYKEMIKNNVEVHIINEVLENKGGNNSYYYKNLIQKINNGNYDFVHIHYDCFYHIIPFLTCKKIGITSHYPYIDNIEKQYSDGYRDIFDFICKNTNHYIFALSKKDYETFNNFCYDKNKIFLILNGSNHNELDTIQDINNKLYYNKSMYLAQISTRKKQELYCKIQDIDFYGNCNTNFKNNDCYKGEPIRSDLIDLLKNYGNLILLSDGENGTPLVIKEALMSGLPIVTNRHSSNDLDTSLDFIDIIPDNRLNDLNYVENIIKENRKKQHMNKEIRNYAVINFSWELLVKKYLQIVQSILY